MTATPATTNTVPEPRALPGNLCAEVSETHTGVVVLLGDKAYKAKKPVATDFLISARRAVANAPVCVSSC